MLTCDDSPPIDLRTVDPNELVRRAHGGCAESFAELSRRFRPRLLNLLEKRLDGRHADAEDVAQEALARAFGRLDDFDSRYRFSTWLYTIAIRLSHDQIRRRRRRLQYVAFDTELCEQAAVNASMPADSRDEADNLWALAKRVLSEAQFTAMWLRYGEDLTAAEVAGVMQRTRIGVRVLLHRARARLLAEFAKHEATELTVLRKTGEPQ